MAAKHSEFTPMCDCWLCVGVMEKTGLSQRIFSHCGHVKTSRWSAAAAAICSAGASATGFCSSDLLSACCLCLKSLWSCSAALTTAAVTHCRRFSRWLKTCFFSLLMPRTLRDLTITIQGTFPELPW